MSHVATGKGQIAGKEGQSGNGRQDDEWTAHS
jgi:hypothetical protein